VGAQKCAWYLHPGACLSGPIGRKSGYLIVPGYSGRSRDIRPYYTAALAIVRRGLLFEVCSCSRTCTDNKSEKSVARWVSSKFASECAHLRCNCRHRLDVDALLVTAKGIDRLRIAEHTFEPGKWSWESISFVRSVSGNLKHGREAIVKSADIDLHFGAGL
jgi:hypothetical protein